MDRGSFEQLFFFFMLQPEWWLPVVRVWRRGSWWFFWVSSQPRRNFVVQRSSQQLLNPRAFETPSLTVSGTLKSMADNQRRSSDRTRSRLIRHVPQKPSQHQKILMPAYTKSHLENVPAYQRNREHISNPDLSLRR
jgi:hypothetical protein